MRRMTFLALSALALAMAAGPLAGKVRRSGVAEAGMAEAGMAESGGTAAEIEARRAIVRDASAVLADPEVRALREAIIAEWSALPEYGSADGKAQLAGAVDDIMWSAASTGVARVQPVPVFMWYEAPAHSVGGTRVPSGRWGVDLPDRFYRTLAVDPGGRYVIRGRRMARPSNPDFSFEAMDHLVRTVNVLRGRDIEIAADGSFAVTVDASPTGGRRNHLTLPPVANTVLVRDTLADWGSQEANALRVEQLGPVRARPTPAELKAAAIAQIKAAVRFNAQLMRRAAIHPVNTLVPFVRSAEDGLAGSIGSMGRFSLADDEAMVVTIDPQGGHYTNIQLCDPWLRSIPYVANLSSLSDRQTKPNADGTITFVIAPRDPGYYNWLSTGGLHDGELTLRIEDVAKPDADKVARMVRVVKLGELGAVVPAGMVRVTPAQRRAQLAARAAGFAARLPR